jgi:hypothetical protein
VPENLKVSPKTLHWGSQWKDKLHRADILFRTRSSREAELEITWMEVERWKLFAKLRIKNDKNCYREERQRAGV